MARGTEEKYEEGIAGWCVIFIHARLTAVETNNVAGGIETNEGNDWITTNLQDE